jgi:EpsI family protein
MKGDAVTVRLLIIAACLLVAMGLGARASQPEQVPLREPLRTLPLQLESWRGREAAPFPDDIVAVLGVDEYLTRSYRNAAAPGVSLYVGYYQSQREGDTIHSPMNCLPGAGWQPVETGLTRIAVPGRPEPLEVNRVVIQKGLERQVAFYWYQSHGRVVANEYWSKIFMVYDAVRLNRSDAALVRVISPIDPRTGDATSATERASDFVRALWPALERHLPS